MLAQRNTELHRRTSSFELDETCREPDFIKYLDVTEPCDFTKLSYSHHQFRDENFKSARYTDHRTYNRHSSRTKLRCTFWRLSSLPFLVFSLYCPRFSCHQVVFLHMVWFIFLLECIVRSPETFALDSLRFISGCNNHLRRKTLTALLVL